MSNRPSESLKEAANRLARLVKEKSNDKDRIEALRQQLGLNHTVPGFLDNTRDSSQTGAPQETGPEDRVGIWVARVNNGKKTYMRDIRFQQDFDLWSKVHEIPPKSTKKRVLYLGESVARGFLLDPLYTPASVLESLLNSKPDLLEAEVIDLAKTNLGLEELVELCSSCIALEPDLIVIFAGNNWLNFERLTGEALAEIGEIIESEGKFEDLTRVLDSQFKETAVSAMRQLAGISGTHRVPVVFMLPEFNLLDYRIAPGFRLISWRKGQTGEWLHLKKECEQALEHGQIDKARSLAQKMITVNPANPTGYEIMARCMLKRQLYPEAVEYLRTALSTAIYIGQNVPSCIPIVQAAVREEAAGSDSISVVDLPAVFSEYCSGMPPGRELFLDYCHLTAEGVRVAMAAAAQRVFSLLARQDVSADQLRKDALQPDKDVLARSHFFAAVHNAHRGDQPFEILYYHCLKALDTSPAVREIMEYFVDIVCRHTIWSLNKSCEKLYENREQKQFPFLLQPRDKYIMDLKLTDAVIAALKEHHIDIEKQAADSRKKEFGFVNGKINLLESYYYLASYESPIMPDYLDYYRAYGVRSRFFLVAENSRDISLTLTYRVPGAALDKEKVILRVNDAMEQELPAAGKWQNVSLQIPGGTLKDGINEIILQWPPDIKYDKHKKKDPSPGNVNWGVLLREKLYPVYGEIHSFTARQQKGEVV
jgi:tetratricopeptide (TPR) repeat protein